MSTTPKKLYRVYNHYDGVPQVILETTDPFDVLVFLKNERYPYPVDVLELTDKISRHESRDYFNSIVRNQLNKEDN